MSVTSVVQLDKPTATLALPNDNATDSVIAGFANVPSADAFAFVSGNRPLLSPRATPTPTTSVPTVHVSSVRAEPSVALKSRSIVATSPASKI